MSAREGCPLLFLDVDGPLLPFGDGPQREPSSTTTDAHLTRLDPSVGPRLAALPCELVWATAWEDEAHTELAARLGLPPLPVVHRPEPSDAHEREDLWFGLHWKTRTLVAWADGRPFVWVDDEITEADRDWVSPAGRNPTGKGSERVGGYPRALRSFQPPLMTATPLVVSVGAQA
ncbi:HAD domain-containing protein [Streptomyces sp. NPDC059070]|uniref:HAD domain-containing protein n=1 Tax=Streptomyces sp. NPDC059070 TaxID=3346713 RepID=UPI00369896F4